MCTLGLHQVWMVKVGVIGCSDQRVNFMLNSMMSISSKKSYTMNGFTSTLGSCLIWIVSLVSF